MGCAGWISPCGPMRSYRPMTSRGCAERARPDPKIRGVLCPVEDFAVEDFSMKNFSVSSTRSCSVFVAHHLSASWFDDLAGLEAVDAPALVSFQAALEPRLSGSLVGFLVRPRDRFFVPTCSASGTPRADAVKAGRRSGASTNSGIASPRLDGGEHGVTLRAIGTSAISSPSAV